jgi:hypothetical protein
VSVVVAVRVHTVSGRRRVVSTNDRFVRVLVGASSRCDSGAGVASFVGGAHNMLVGHEANGGTSTSGG